MAPRPAVRGERCAVVVARTWGSTRDAADGLRSARPLPLESLERADPLRPDLHYALELPLHPSPIVIRHATQLVAARCRGRLAGLLLQLRTTPSPAGAAVQRLAIPSVEAFDDIETVAVTFGRARGDDLTRYLAGGVVLLVAEPALGHPSAIASVVVSDPAFRADHCDGDRELTHLAASGGAGGMTLLRHALQAHEQVALVDLLRRPGGRLFALEPGRSAVAS